MPIACLSIPHFALRVALLSQPELDGTPLVLSTPPGGRSLVEDRTPEAAARGIRTGMSLKEATALCPSAVIIHPDPVRDAEVFERIIGRLEALSPLVEPERPGVCYIDLYGLQRHYGSPERAAERLLRTTPPILRPRIGIATGKFSAWLASQEAAPGTTLVLQDSELNEFLAGQPVERLPLKIETIRRLEQLGIRTFANLRALPISAVQARFGPAGRDAWRLARGEDDSRVEPRRYEETVIEHLNLPAPAVSHETLLIGMRQLITRAFSRPTMRHRAARQARLLGLIEGGGSWEHVATLREPMDAPRLIKALGHRLHTVELPGPLEALTLELSGLTVEAAHQEALLGARPRRTRQIVDAIRQLKQRYGASPIYHIVEVEPWSRIPERRRALISYDP